MKLMSYEIRETTDIRLIYYRLSGYPACFPGICLGDIQPDSRILIIKIKMIWKVAKLTLDT